MGGRLVSVAAITAAFLAVSPARALSFKDISGKWCTEAGSSEFTEKALIIRKSDGSRSEVKIDRYDFGDEMITIFWTRSDKAPASTHYTDFSADGGAMAQLQSDNGPRREFRRC